MRVLITLFSFGLGGTESYTATVAEQLERLGHSVRIHAVHVGPGGAELAAARGLRLTSGDHQIGDLAEIDAALVQELGSAYLLARRPELRRAFVVHGLAPFETPLVGGSGTETPVVVLNDRMRGRIEALAPRPAPVRLRQPIDLDRFRPRSANRRRAKRLLALSNSIAGDRLAMLEAACADLGLELVRVGGFECRTAAPEQVIADADIVVGYGRSVLEAMAMGKPAYVWERWGGDGWVTPENYASLEADGFSGSATGTIIDAERLRADLAAYTPELGLLGYDLVRTHHLATKHTEALVRLLEEAEPRQAPDHEAAEAMALMVRAHTRALGHVHGLEQEVVRLRLLVDAETEAAATARAAAEAERGRRLAAEAQLRGLVGSRSWRLTEPLRRLRPAVSRARNGARSSSS
ncbi:MAG: hypothetical protein U0R71_00120 [Solirubrobacterales bacterium]